MLLELAIGDAYGAGFEYADRDTVAAHNTLERYARHPRHGIAPGRYTDDTQMSIAVAAAVVSGKPWTPLMLAQRFVDAFKRDPREGYAMGFQAFLRRVRDGEQFMAEIAPTSDKSGAAMRAAPIGVYPTIEDVVGRATAQARITHDTPDGIAAAVAAALIAHYFVHDRGPRRELGAFLDAHAPAASGGRWSEPWHGKVKSKGWMSVRAAVTAIVAEDSLSAILRRCVAYCGDVDTVAAIALAAASCSREVAQDLPPQLVWALENEPYGRDYLIALDKRLLSRVRPEASA